MRDFHTQYPQKLNVWAEILKNTIIEPFFLNENVNSMLRPSPKSLYFMGNSGFWARKNASAAFIFSLSLAGHAS